MRGRPLNHDDASCFNASQLSVNRSIADFMKNMFSGTAILSESTDCHIVRKRGGGMSRKIQGKNWSGWIEIGSQNWSPFAKNSLRAYALFTSIVEATGFTNRCHQHSVVI